MPAKTIDEGTGATITLGTSTWEATALITAITPDAVKREALETTYLATTGYRTYVPEDLADAGGFTLEFFHGGNEQPPIGAVAETITLTFPDGALITGSGFFTEYTPGAVKVGELMMATATVKWAGAVTFTDAT